MADKLEYRDGHVECSKCRNLVYHGDTRWPHLCSDCVAPLRAEAAAIGERHAAGAISTEERDAQIAALA